MERNNFHYADDEDVAVLLPNDGITPDNRLSPARALCPANTTYAVTTIEDFVDTTIVLKKDNNELGISVTGGNDTYLEAIVVTDVLRYGAAFQDGRLKRGDVLLAVNDMSLRDISFKEAVKLLREAASPVRLLVVRENPQTLFTTHQMLTSSDIPRKFIMVELRKTSVKDKLGMSFIQRTNGRGVFITYVQPGSIAAQHGQRIMQGDEILEVNGQNVRDRNQKDMAELLLVVRHGCGHPALFRSVAVDSFCGPRGLAAISGY